MYLKHTYLENFKKFEKKAQKWEKNVLITGSNGSGKSTLALSSVLFGIWGYSMANSLGDLPTRNIAKSCMTEHTIRKDKDIYKIIRKYPTKLEIYKNEELLKFITNREAQYFIDDLLGDREQFQQFRVIDAYSKESNFLEQGQTALKNIIFSLNEKRIKKIRDNLREIKRQREIFNKDNLVKNIHYYSEKRKSILKTAYDKIQYKIETLKDKVENLENKSNKNTKKIGKLENSIEYFESRIDKLESLDVCYVCEQEITEELKTDIIQKFEKKIKEIVPRLESKVKDNETMLDIIVQYEKKVKKLETKEDNLERLLSKLERNPNEKKYKYTTKDVEIVSRAIKELDNFSSYYLTESIKVLEPIINKILNKINFKVSFEVNEKGKFNVLLTKEEVQFNYKDLSTGEKLILQIAFKLALLMERGEDGLIIADEGLGSLDKSNLDYILKIFNEFPFQLILILHRFDNIPEDIQLIELD